MSLSPMSHVEFKKVPCRTVDFGGQGPFFGVNHCGCVVYKYTVTQDSLTHTPGTDQGMFRKELEGGVQIEKA